MRPGKWTVKEVLGHITDTERIFTYRPAVRAAPIKRRFPDSSRMTTCGVRVWRADTRGLAEEFGAVRQRGASAYFVRSRRCLPRRGLANQKEMDGARGWLL